MCEPRRTLYWELIRTCHLGCEIGHLGLYDHNLGHGLGGRLCEERSPLGHVEAMGSGHHGVENGVQLEHAHVHVQNQTARMQMEEF